MRPKSGVTKKTPPSKKDAVATAAESGEKTPVAATAKATPKSGPGKRAAKGAGRQSTPRSAAAASAVPAADATATASPVVSSAPPDAVAPPTLAPSDPKVEQNVVEETTSGSTDKKGALIAKSHEEQVAAKTSAPLTSSVKAAVVNEPTEEPEEAKNQLGLKSEDPGADVHPVNANVEEKHAILKKSEEEIKPDAFNTEGKAEKQDTPENEAVASDMKEDIVESTSVIETEGGLDETFVNKVGESSQKAVTLGEEGHVMEEHGEQEDFENGNEDMTGEEEKDDEVDVGEEEAGLKEEEEKKMSDIVRERKKEKELEIFVGGLDRDATEEDVRKVFEKVGVVEDVRLHKDFTTNKNKGFAFVKFANKEQASRAISELKNPIIHGKRCGVATSEDNDTLFLGNICNTWTKEAIKRRLKEYGVEGVENIKLVEDTQNEGLSRGFAFLEFSCHEYAMNAYKRLQKPDVVFGHAEWSAKVAFAEPLREPDAEIMAQVKSVFVDGMPPYWDEDRVKEHFKGYGEIERVVLARNMPTAKRMDFGFVNFTTHEAAVACVGAVNNTELGDGKSKMKARARLANPMPKTQAVKGGIRGGFRIGAGFFPRFGRGFGRGRLSFPRAGFNNARGFHLRGRGRGGRFSFPLNNIESSHVDFRGRRPFGVRGGLRGSFRDGTYGRMSDDFSPRSRRGGFDARHGRPFQMRREPFAFDGDYGGPYDGGHFAEDPYYYGDMGHGMKRPYSMMEHDSSYLEPGSRVRPRYDLADPFSAGAHYRDSVGNPGGLYSHDYYGSDYGGSGYSSLYRGEGSGGGYYY